MANISISGDSGVSATTRSVASDIAAKISASPYAPNRAASYIVTNNPFLLPSLIYTAIVELADRGVVSQSEGARLKSDFARAKLSASDSTLIDSYIANKFQGFTTKANNYIFISKTVPAENLAGTILHEIGHKLGVPDGSGEKGLHNPAFYKWVMDVGRELGISVPDQEQKFIDSGGKADDHGFLELLPSLNAEVREQVANGLINQEEYQQFLSWASIQERAFAIADEFETLLGHDPDLATFNEFMHNGMTIDQIGAILAAASGHRSYYIESQYQELLGHSAPECGMSWFMSNGMTVDQIRSILLDNPEHRMREDIKAIYHSQLGRAPTEAELDDNLWNRKTVIQTAKELAASKEYRDIIQKSYQELLGHDAPESGSSWFMSNGMTLEQMRPCLRENPEYILRENIKSVYAARLERAATEAELDDQVWYRKPLNQIDRDLALSGEYRDIIQKTYQQLVGRDADAGALSWFASNGMSISQMRQSIMDSSEYQTREAIKAVYLAQVGRAARESEIDDNMWYRRSPEQVGLDLTTTPEYRTFQIPKLYHELFGRDLDPAGLQSWDRSGQSMDQIRSSMMATPEYRALHPSAPTPSIVVAPIPVPEFTPPDSAPMAPLYFGDNILAPDALTYWINWLRESGTNAPYRDPYAPVSFDHPLLYTPPAIVPEPQLFNSPPSITSFDLIS